MHSKEILQYIDVPEYLWDYTDYILDEADWKLVESGDENRYVNMELFTEEELNRGYKRGILNKEIQGEKTVYKVGFFMRAIDCCLRGRREYWDSIPAEVKEKMIFLMQDVKKWIIDEPDGIIVEVLPIEDALQKVEDHNGIFYLQECDCRNYHGECGKPKKTCLHFAENNENAINTTLDRGYSCVVSKDEAVETMKTADKAGLIHCFEGHGFCNCCSDCCWSLRAKDRLEKEFGYNLRENKYRCEYIISVQYNKCKNCGACVSLCPFGVLSKGDNHIEVDSSKCWGCGVCRTRCAFGALELIKFR